MEEKKPKIVKNIDILVPLSLFGHTHDNLLFVYVYDNGEVCVAMEVSKEELGANCPANYDGRGSAILEFEEVDDSIHKVYMSKYLGFDVYTRVAVKELSKVEIVEKLVDGSELVHSVNVGLK